MRHFLPPSLDPQKLPALEQISVYAIRLHPIGAIGGSGTFRLGSMDCSLDDLGRRHIIGCFLLYGCGGRGWLGNCNCIA